MNPFFRMVFVDIFRALIWYVFAERMSSWTIAFLCQPKWGRFFKGHLSLSLLFFMVNGDAPIIEIVKHRWVISVWLCLNGHVRWSLQRFQRWITIGFYIQFSGQQDLPVWIVAHVQIIMISKAKNLQKWHHEFHVMWHGVLFYIQGWSSSLRSFVWHRDICSPYTLDYLRSRLPLWTFESWRLGSSNICWRKSSTYLSAFFPKRKLWIACNLQDNLNLIISQTQGYHQWLFTIPIG